MVGDELGWLQRMPKVYGGKTIDGLNASGLGMYF